MGRRKLAMSVKIAVTLIATLLCGRVAAAQNSPQIVINTADWTAADALGRTLPTYKDVGDPKPGRWVGLFYWQWHGDDRWGPDYNVTEFLTTHPGFRDFQAFPPGGPEHPTWYWAEPLFGYYRSTDPWVIRKHLALLADAGVDFLFLDYTNGSVYDDALATLLKVARDLKDHGVAVPRLVFFLNFEPEWKIEHLYRAWYAPGKYDDLWFRWRGKPLMMAPAPTDGMKLKDPSLLPAIRQYFTFRPTWAFFDAEADPTRWRFMDTTPQRPARGPDGKIEEMVVSKALGGPINDNMRTGSVSSVPGHVPAYNDQWVSPDAARGLFFQAQWDEAEKVAAPVLLVTGWNEWKASVWETPGVPMLGRVTQKGQGHIVDEFNQEFDRDLEPMRGGYGDDYYWQFVSNMRRYKGMRRPQAPSARRPIPMDGTFTAWDRVTPVYRDTAGDTADRDWPGAVPAAHYVDRSARHDIVMAQVARDLSMVYFHVRTASRLTPPTGTRWMTLLIDSDGDPRIGWHGYNLLVNRARTGQMCTVERYVGSGGAWRWRRIADAPIRWAGRDLEIALPRRLFGPGSLAFDFKWADNLPAAPDVMDFYSQGDVAPDARFSYHYAAP